MIVLRYMFRVRCRVFDMKEMKLTESPSRTHGGLIFGMQTMRAQLQECVKYPKEMVLS